MKSNRHTCRLCGLEITHGAVCPRCLDTVMASRAALRTLIETHYIERVGEHGYLIKQPEAMQIAQLLDDEIVKLGAGQYVKHYLSRKEKQRRLSGASAGDGS